MKKEDASLTFIKIPCSRPCAVRCHLESRWSMPALIYQLKQIPVDPRENGDSPADTSTGMSRLARPEGGFVDSVDSVRRRDGPLVLHSSRHGKTTKTCRTELICMVGAKAPVSTSILVRLRGLCTSRHCQGRIFNALGAKPRNVCTALMHSARPGKRDPWKVSRTSCVIGFNMLEPSSTALAWLTKLTDPWTKFVLDGLYLHRFNFVRAVELQGYHQLTVRF